MKQHLKVPDPVPDTRPGRPTAEEIKRTTKPIPKSEVDKPERPVRDQFDKDLGKARQTQ
jgi:hypothetical protein